VFSAMMAYQFGYVDAQLQPIDVSGGKRFRPLLCLLACEGVGGTLSQALTVAASIEILHNFSLVHDDIEDRDPIRRHRPTVWKVWGEAQGINIGDGMFAAAGRAILDAPVEPTTVLDIARRFGETARALTEGQYLDMSFEARGDVHADEYSLMVEKKTGSLIDFSLWAGARVGGADARTLSGISVFGTELGKAFQIHDDISGIWAAQDRTGKEPGKDLHNHKKTLPVLQAAEHAKEPYRSVLAAYIRSEPVDVSEVIHALDQTEARAHAEERVHRHLGRARQALSEARLEPTAAHSLADLAAELTGQDLANR
jgi:geranylgeranyl diphosphate synthase, type I